MTSKEESDIAMDCAIHNYEGSKTAICVLLGFEVATLVGFTTFTSGYSLTESDWLITAGFLLLIVSVGIMSLAFAGEYFYDSISPIDEDYEEQIVGDVEKAKEAKKKRARTSEDVTEAEIEADTELQHGEKLKDSHLLVLRGDSNRLELYLGLSVTAYMLALSAFLASLLSPVFGLVMLVFVLGLMYLMVKKFRMWKHYSEKLSQ